jgi:hypothetical protein
VIRDDAGRFIATCNNPIYYEIDTNTAEARDKPYMSHHQGYCIDELHSKRHAYF